MKRRSHAKKVDGNQAQIVKDLRLMGFSVEVIGEPVDLLIGRHGRTWLWEVKNPDAPNPRDTPKQTEFFKTWRGHVYRGTTVEGFLMGIHE